MLARRTSGTNYDFSEKSPKKEKRWSFGNLFRRKKKQNCGDSSSEEENGNKKKNKCNKKKRNIVGFDHVLIPPSSSRSSTFLNGYKNQNDSFLSEPNISNNFIPASSFTTRYVPLKESRENLDQNGSNKSLGSPQIGSLGRKKKEVIKARAEARRDTSKGEESSDEDSQKSVFKSDESLAKYKDGSLNRRSRAARTQRYLKRRSKDEEILDQLMKPNRSDIEHAQNFKPTKSNSSASSRSSFSGLSTIPPSHSRYKVTNLTNGYMPKSSSHDYNNIRNKNPSTESNHQRSVSCSSNLENDNLLGKSHNKSSNIGMKQPPAPPPRDLKRYLGVPNCDDRPNSYSFDSRNGSDQNVITEIKPNCRSTSEDHIFLEQNQRIPLVPRPSSAIPNTNHLQKLNVNNQSANNGYYYFADKNPRSRKPISVQQNKPFDFWKQKDEEFARSNSKTSNPNSPLMFTAQTHVRTTTFLPNGITIQTDSSIVNPSDDANRVVSPFRPIIKSPSPINTDQIKEQKPSNFEDALDELEAIYNSLHLGDEDLLERAEQREAAAAQKRRDALFESFPNSIPHGTLSDSSFGYDFNPTKRKHYSKKLECDRKADDMAFRKLNKDRYNTISDPQSVTSRISYLLTSPVFNNSIDDYNSIKLRKKNKEPHVTLDDVVYRNVKHTNDALKVADPQPPFGIPVGPISPASNSDYLHATPEETRRSMFKPKKIPDVVKDDLAYRNLRKDPNKEPALPLLNLSPEDYRKSYSNNNKSGRIRRKPVRRSLSANISNLLYENIGDVDTFEVSRQVLKDKENEINGVHKAFMSDGELICDKNDEIEKQIQQSTIDELLSSLAVETHEANECIDNELKMCDEEKKLKKALAESVSLDNKNIEMLKELDTLNLQMPKEDSTSEHTKLCKKLLECVVESTELLATPKVESEPSEEVDRIQIEPLLQTVANVVLTTDDQSKNRFDPVSTEVFSESDHDYLNIQSEIDNEVQELLRVVNNDDDVNSVSPLGKHKAQLLAAFEELRLSERSENIEHDKKTDKGGGEECVSVQYIALPVKEGCAFINEYYFNFDNRDLDTKLVEKPNSLDTTHEELVDIRCDTYNVDNSCDNIDLESCGARICVNSEQTEQNNNLKQNSNLVSIKSDSENNNNCASTDCALKSDNSKSNQLQLRHTLEPTRIWCEDPAIIAFACSCGIACTTQLPNLDIVALLGLLFAIILLLIALLARI